MSTCPRTLLCSGGTHDEGAESFPVAAAAVPVVTATRTTLLCAPNAIVVGLDLDKRLMTIAKEAFVNDSQLVAEIGVYFNLMPSQFGQ